MSLTATFDSTLSRVQLSATSLGASATRATVERSHNELLWETVRGGASLPVSGQEAGLVEGDAEFFADVTTHYRITSHDSDGVQQQQFTTSILASLGGKVWLKSPRFPALNTALGRVLDRGEDRRRADRGTVTEIQDRSVSVGIGARAGSPQFTLVAQTPDDAAADRLDLVLAVGGAGGAFFIHVPPSLPQVPGGYVAIHTTAQQRANDRERYAFTLPCTVVAPPDALVVPTNLTVGTVINLYGSVAAVWAAHPTVRSLWETVASPSDLLAL